MKNILVIFFVIFSVSVSAQNFAENRNAISGAVVTPTFHCYLSKDFNKKVGMWSYLLVNKYWGEALGGGSCNIGKNCQIGLGGGFEQSNPYWRAAGFFFFAKNRNTIFYFGETGASKYWYQAYWNYDFGNAGVGFIGQRFIGYGIRGQVKFSRFILWGAPCYDFTSHGMKGLLALRVKF